MKFLLVLLIAFFLLLVFILMSTLHIEIKAKRKGSNDLIKISLKMWFGLIRLQKEFSLLNLSKDATSIKYRTQTKTQAKQIEQGKSTFSIDDLLKLRRQTTQLLHRVHKLNKIMKAFLRKVYFDKLVWHTGIGSGDAAETGTITGLVWGIKASMVGMISTYVTLRTLPRLFVQPYFNEKRLETEFKCIFRFRIGHAMLAGIRILLNFRKRRDSTWQNTLFRA